MADSETSDCPELLALKKCYNKLTLALPLDDIVPKLISQRVITIADKQEIMAQPSDAKKIQYFLDNTLIRQLSVGNTKEFDIFFNVLKQNMKGGFLAGELEKELEKARREAANNGEFQVDIAYLDAGIPTREYHCYASHIAHERLNLSW